MAAVNNNLSNLLTNATATPPITNVAGSDAARLKVSTAYATVPNSSTDSAGSKYRMSRIGSSAVIHSLKFAGTAQTAGAFNIGLYTSNPTATGAAVSASLFAAAVSCASAVPLTEERFNALALTTAGKRVWELLGLSADPAIQYDVVCTSSTASTDGGTILTQVIWSE